MATLKLPEMATDDNGPHMVLGVPSNQTALIMRIQGRWRLLRTIRDVSTGEEPSGGWTGSFDTAANALAALQAELSN
jgi:hypothetical protein